MHWIVVAVIYTDKCLFFGQGTQPEEAHACLFMADYAHIPIQQQSHDKLASKHQHEEISHLAPFPTWTNKKKPVKPVSPECKHTPSILTRIIHISSPTAALWLIHEIARDKYCSLWRLILGFSAKWSWESIAQCQRWEVSEHRIALDRLFCGFIAATWSAAKAEAQLTVA